MFFKSWEPSKVCFNGGICIKKHVRNHKEKQYFIGLFKKHNSYFQREIQINIVYIRVIQNYLAALMFVDKTEMNFHLDIL